MSIDAMSTEDYIAQIEAEQFEACKAAAQAIGIDGLEAENCNNGEFKCPECPWKSVFKGVCHQCGAKRKYSWFESSDNPIDGYDAHYCDICDIWLEKRCSDPECEFCAARPERPSDLLK